MLFGRVKVYFWGSGAEGPGHARAGVGMTWRGGVKAVEVVQRVRVGGDGPREERAPSAGRDVGARGMVCAGLQAEAGYS